MRGPSRRGAGEQGDGGRLAPQAGDGDPRIVVGNEFGSVELRLCTRGNGQQVVITDRHSGTARQVDVLALEGLVWAPEWVMASLADPGLPDRPDGNGSDAHRRWTGNA